MKKAIRLSVPSGIGLYAKAFYSLFFCLLLALPGCKTDEAPYIELSAAKLDFTKTAGEQTININANVAWQSGITPASAASWLTVSPANGTGNSTVIVSVKANDGYDDRTASVTFQSAGGVQTLQVTQHQSDAVRAKGDKEYAVWQPGGTLPVTIERNVAYTVEISTDAQAWIHPVATKALVSEQLAFDIDENTTELLRYGEIYLKGKASGSDSVTPGLTDTIKIYQQALSLGIDYETLQFGPYAQKKWLTVTSTHQYCPDASDDSFSVSDYTYTLSDGAEAWCTVEKNSDNADYLSVSVTENTTDELRTAEITVTSSVLSRTVHIEQKAGTGGIYADGESKEIQLHDPTKGNGVNVVIMGDGFTRADLEYNGVYETAMRKAAGYFFSVEPFTSHKAYFNVYMIAVESPESGVNDSAAPNAPKINNALNSTIGQGTSITWDAGLCAQYVHNALGFPLKTVSTGEKYIDRELLVILVLNTPRYAGTTTLYTNGYCVAACPMSTEPAPADFEGLIHHEAGGHGFGLFEDEYVYYNQAIPTSITRDIQDWQQAGFYQNVDFTANTMQIRWKEFIGSGTYSYVGAYEGACTYGRGVWRPEENTCMNDNIPYYSAPCRMYITNRIRRLAGKPELSFAGFAAADNVTPPTKTKSGVPYRTMPPLGRPRMIEVN